MNVLLADDETDVREIAQVSLELGPFKVRAVENGAEALAAAMQDSPDLIVLDAMMPVLDGLATLARLKQTPELRDIPVILLTARVQAAEVREYLALGAAGVVQKPFDPTTLASDVAAIVERARVADPGQHDG